MSDTAVHQPAQNRPAVQIFLVVLMIAASLGVFWFFISFSGVNANERATLADMISGKADRPFVTRALVPWLTRGTAALLPESIHVAASEAAGESAFLATLLESYRAPQNLALEAMISLFWQLASILGFAFTLRNLIRKVYDTPPMFAELVTIGGLMALAPMLLFGYIYDLPNLFLTTLGLYCIVSNWKRRYYLVFALAILNKETAVVLFLPAVLLDWHFPRPSLSKIVVGILIQLGIFFTIRVPLNQLYRANPGGAMEYHLLDHLDLWQNYPLIGVLSVLAALGMLWLIFKGWQTKPAAVVLGVLPGLGLLVLFVVSGIPFEIRVFYEVYSAGWLCTLATLTARKSPLKSKLPVMQEWLDSLPGLFSRQVRRPHGPER